MSALGLVLNLLVLWNTRYTERILARMRSAGVEVRAEDVARLSPLGFAHITILGRYQFVVPESVRRGDYRPLRDPGAAEAEAAGGASTGFPFR